MRSIKHIAYPLVLVALATGCARTHKPSVWDMYDVRHPVPADSQVPISQATQYDQYIDNDEYYTPPEAYDPD
jgi:hypothetical protein